MIVWLNEQLVRALGSETAHREGRNRWMGKWHEYCLACNVGDKNNHNCVLKCLPRLRPSLSFSCAETTDLSTVAASSMVHLPKSSINFLLPTKALHNQARCYLTNMLHRHIPSRSLASTDLNEVIIRSCKDYSKFSSSLIKRGLLETQNKDR